MIRRLSLLVAASGFLPGCFTYSAVHTWKHPGSMTAKGMVQATLAGDLLPGAVIGGIAAGEADRRPEVAFLEGVAVWSMLDLCVGFPIAMIEVAREAHVP